MCLVLDTNVFHKFFPAKKTGNLDYIPVWEWVIEGRGKLIFGGTKYKEELKQSRKYLKMFTELERSRKLVKLNDSQVDSIESRLKTIENSPSFNDAHLIAIIIESKCKIICTDDREAIPFLKNKNLYGKSKRPKIYSSRVNSGILNDINIVDICKPCQKLPKKTLEKIALQN